MRGDPKPWTRHVHVPVASHHNQDPILQVGDLLCHRIFTRGRSVEICCASAAVTGTNRLVASIRRRLAGMLSIMGLNCRLVQNLWAILICINALLALGASEAHRWTNSTPSANGSAATTPTAAATASKPSKASREPQVLIIGAGMAGVAAARQLTDAGMSVVVLEARDRPGGRMHAHTSRYTYVGLCPFNPLRVQLSSSASNACIHHRTAPTALQ